MVRWKVERLDTLEESPHFEISWPCKLLFHFHLLPLTVTIGHKHEWMRLLSELKLRRKTRVAHQQPRIQHCFEYDKFDIFYSKHSSLCIHTLYKTPLNI